MLFEFVEAWTDGNVTPSARIQAAIDILDDVLGKQRRFDEYFRNWARHHRYAGSKDRAAIKETVFQVFRSLGELRWRAPEASSRLLIAGLLHWRQELPLKEVDGLFSGQKYAPKVLSADERALLSGETPRERPVWVDLNIPEWLEPQLRAQFGADLLLELEAMSGRAPLHVRANTLKISREKLLTELASHGIEAVKLDGCADGLGVAAETQLLTLDPYRNGWFEIQDLGSQLAGAVCGAQPGMTVIDLAAGAGGKTLQLAAAMKNEGRLIACDVDRRRLERLVVRAKRAGVTNVETCVLTNQSREDLLDRFGGRAHVVLIDAPCSGSGTWRRKPEARWWLSPELIDSCGETQGDLLRLGSQLVADTGKLVYVTCSILPAENQEIAAAFEAEAREFEVIPPHAIRELAGLPAVQKECPGPGLQLTPHRHNTDGFFISVFRKNPGRSS